MNKLFCSVLIVVVYAISVDARYVDPDGLLSVEALMLNSQINSHYGYREFHPVTKQGFVFHKGTDTYSLDGRVRAAGRGIVNNISYQMDPKTGKGYGNQILVKHFHPDGNVYRSRYAHLKKRPEYEIEDVITEGQYIGEQGDTGGTTGPHLHFGVERYNPGSMEWESIDPMSINLGQFDTAEQLDSFVGPPRADGTY